MSFIPDRTFVREHFVLILGLALPLALIVIFSLARMITEASVAPPAYKAVYAQLENYANGKFNYQVAQDGTLVVTYTGPQPYNGQQPQTPVLARAQVMVFDPVTGAQEKYPVEVADSMKPGTVTVATDKLPRLRIKAGTIAPDGYAYNFDSYSRNSGIFGDIFGYGHSYDQRYAIGKKGKTYLLPLNDRYSQFDFIGWDSIMFAGPRHDALTQIADLARQHALTLDEIAEALVASPATVHENQKNISQIVIRILSYLGAVLVFAGLGIYTGLEWIHMSPLSRVVITLGPGIVAFMLGIACLQDEKFQRVSTPLFILSALMQPAGLIVYLHEYFTPTGNTELALAAVFALVGLQQFAGFKAYGRTALLFFTVVFGYAAIGLLLGWLDADEKIWGLLLSFSALCVTSAIHKSRHRVLTPWFLLLSGGAFIAACFFILSATPPCCSLILTAGFLYAGVILTIFRTVSVPRPVFMFFVIGPFFSFMAGSLEALSWDERWIGLAIGSAGMLVAYGLRTTLHKKLAPLLFLIFGFMVSGAIHELLVRSSLDVLMIGYGAALMYLSVVIASRTLLFVSVMTLLGYLASFTQIYFAHTVGWPVSLIGLGLALILISSYAVRLGQKITAAPKV